MDDRWFGLGDRGRYPPQSNAKVAVINSNIFAVFTAASFLFLAASAPAQVAPPKDAAPGTEFYSTLKEPWRGYMIANWTARIDKAESDVESLKKQLRGVDRATKKIIGARIRSTKKKIKELKKNDPPYIPRLRVAHIQTGAFGKPRMIDAKVKQVIDENTMLVGIEDAQHGGDRYNNWVMVKCPTTGIVDGKFWRDWDSLIGNNMLVVTGTTTYATAGGSTKTVFVLESVSIDSMKETVHPNGRTPEQARTAKTEKDGG